MFHLTGAEGTVVAASLTATSYFMLARRQKPANEASQESRDILVDVKSEIADLRRTLASHTADDAQNFRELRGAMGPRRRWRLMPALGLLVHLFLK